MFAVEYHLPKKFVWKPTFAHYDKQPFGCEVFDSLLLSCLPHGYALSKKSFYQLEQEDTVGQCKGILAIADDLILSSVDVKALLRMADRGNKIMLVSTLFGTNLEDTLDFRTYYSYFSPMALKIYAGWEILQCIHAGLFIFILNSARPTFGWIRSGVRSWHKG